MEPTPPSEYSTRNLVIVASQSLKIHPKKEGLPFGHYFTDHMLIGQYSVEKGWHSLEIRENGPISLSPSCSVFHYGVEVFEGMKAFRSSDGKIRLFRPYENAQRFQEGCRRLCLPTIPAEEFVSSVAKLVQMDRSWIPEGDGYSLYIRPFMIGTHENLGVTPSTQAMFMIILSPVGSYYESGFSPVNLLATDIFVRAWPGGTGMYKVGGNYANTLLAQAEAKKGGFDQVLWLYNGEVTEVGSMNIFVLAQEKGGQVLLTPPLINDLILPGVTRDSVLQICREKGIRWEERTIYLDDLLNKINKKEILEIFGSGTAVAISPVKKITHKGVTYELDIDPATGIGPMAQLFWQEITDIQYGRKTSEWASEIGD